MDLQTTPHPPSKKKIYIYIYKTQLNLSEIISVRPKHRYKTIRWTVFCAKWRCVVGWVNPDVSNEPAFSFFLVHLIHESEGNKIVRNVGKTSHNDAAALSCTSCYFCTSLNQVIPCSRNKYIFVCTIIMTLAICTLYRALLNRGTVQARYCHCLLQRTVAALRMVGSTAL